MKSTLRLKMQSELQEAQRMLAAVQQEKTLLTAETAGLRDTLSRHTDALEHTRDAVLWLVVGGAVVSLVFWCKEVRHLFCASTAARALTIVRAAAPAAAPNA